MKNYTITMIPPESSEAPMWSAHCKENGFTTENSTPEEALVSLFDAIRIGKEWDKESQDKQEASRFRKKSPIFSKEVTFQIPSFA